MLQNFILKQLIRKTAKAHGFLDPIQMFSQVSRFGKPSEVLAPTELLRATAILHARGLLNAQVIQHNLDWIWPYWVYRQFNPEDASFVPRAFSLTHINLTHRNWTAVGLPWFDQTPIVDPAGLLTPFWDSWSIDAWVLSPDKTNNLIPARHAKIHQELKMNNDLCVVTRVHNNDMDLKTQINVIEQSGHPTCRMSISSRAPENSQLIVSLRPANPEGVSCIKEISLLKNQNGFEVNKEKQVLFNIQPDQYAFSNYMKGDVYHRLNEDNGLDHIKCSLEMASAAAVFHVGPEGGRDILVDVPLVNFEEKTKTKVVKRQNYPSWDEILSAGCQLENCKEQIKSLYDSSLRTVILHTADDVYAGPYTYKRFWFRDAVFISYALLCLGFYQKVEDIIDRFHERQTFSGYFESQAGEWDSNGQVLWLIKKYCDMTGHPPKKEWKTMITRAAAWIGRKRLADSDKDHAGLMPAGFSAEHLGPNDFYYWDNFWSVAGLNAAAYLFRQYKSKRNAQRALKEYKSLMKAINRSIKKAESKLKKKVLPSSVYRRLDSACVGSLVSGYPLQIFGGKSLLLKNTADYLFNNHCIKDGFFHDMSHSGINPYLTLHIAQVFLRTGDNRYKVLMNNIADLSSDTGQWPEAVHPQTKGGCMGDGQHTWAAAEWLLMIRNCFVREEEKEKKLILCSGIQLDWFQGGDVLSFGPVMTSYGTISLRLQKNQQGINLQWEADWHDKEPKVEVRLPEGDWQSSNGKGANLFLKAG